MTLRLCSLILSAGFYVIKAIICMIIMHLRYIHLCHFFYTNNCIMYKQSVFL